MNIKTIEAEFIGGSEITESVEEAVELATNHNCVVNFNFNGQNFTVNANSVIGLLVEKYYEHISVIGP